MKRFWMSDKNDHFLKEIQLLLLSFTLQTKNSDKNINARYKAKQ